MPITCDQFVETVAQALQQGKSESASGVYPDWIRSLLPMGMAALASKVALDPARRGLLVKRFEVQLVDGIGDMLEAESRQMLKSALGLAGCYDSAQRDPITDDIVTLIYKKNWQDVEEKSRYLDINFSYYSLRDNTVVTRASDTVGQIIGPLHLYCSYIPDFEAFPLPYELAGDAMEEVIALAAPAMMKK